MCCSVYQCVAVLAVNSDETRNQLFVAVRCRALQCVSIFCSLLQSVAVLEVNSDEIRNQLFVAVRCSALQCVSMCCSALQSVAVLEVNSDETRNQLFVAVRCNCLLQVVWQYLWHPWNEPAFACRGSHVIRPQFDEVFRRETILRFIQQQQQQRRQCRIDL